MTTRRNSIIFILVLFLVAESATIEMAFPDVCLKVRKSKSLVAKNFVVQQKFYISFLVAESATIEMAFPGVCLKVRKSESSEV